MIDGTKTKDGGKTEEKTKKKKKTKETQEEEAHTSRPAFIACAAAMVSFSCITFFRMLPTAEQSLMTTASGRFH